MNDPTSRFPRSGALRTLLFMVVVGLAIALVMWNLTGDPRGSPVRANTESRAAHPRPDVDPSDAHLHAPDPHGTPHAAAPEPVPWSDLDPGTRDAVRALQHVEDARLVRRTDGTGTIAPPPPGRTPVMVAVRTADGSVQIREYVPPRTPDPATAIDRDADDEGTLEPAAPTQPASAATHPAP